MEEKRKITFYFNEIYDDKKVKKEHDPSTMVHVNYCSKKKIDIEERKRIRKEIRNYMDNEFNFDENGIIDIIKKIRELTDNIEESILEVSIKNEEYGEYANYEHGEAYTCGVYKEVFGDEVSVSSNSGKIDIKLKKDRFYLDSKEKIDLINKELNALYKKVMILNNLENTKTNKEEDVKILNLKNI